MLGLGLLLVRLGLFGLGVCFGVWYRAGLVGWVLGFILSWGVSFDFGVGLGLVCLLYWFVNLSVSCFG